MRAATAAAALVATVLLLAGAADAAGIKKIALLAVKNPQDKTQATAVKDALSASWAKFTAANPTSGITFWVAIKDKSVLPAPADGKKWEGKKDAAAGTYVRYDVAAIWKFPSAEAFSAYSAWKKANSNKDAWKALPIANKAGFVAAA
ncbi:hypothetical protein MNEG_11318 [Monoraphidium neglectum]|uniref:Uncharacterized protein n=1 Tax=Monoraphidium neglectum TaxID=145388 RepID=A0A0D2LZ58_9CHLO|nr:hypothetical protein MNEG_11318 [Monoraphidium neglectum]KIY96644.1 hypothetical protein MNEG_11318 [Monoraphidium neglectum]|eukprot:XP_013895664.1 hypothetical protein MNEG_11318 [Monoraphidium neglectum]